ncbi:hypothetical protein CPB83DRAFT_844850 [Crepidotus variabilis]|uniref:CDP-diacylglycerol--glycerol-3-phosphate 3-phosphatidyltransferase n=1 Tax=Crepidotus variabilis TaxID=179855 RepID=A0A9P6ES66_9AGAR|nr:hypothetical protein CPB83DRAFT_844850 [Crepidotus variabilis]
MWRLLLWNSVKAVKKAHFQPVFNKVARKWASSSSLESSVSELATVLASTRPTFFIPAASVQVLSEPSEFYNALLIMIRKAEKRIFLSSLYIGAEETELMEALQNRLREKPHLQVDILLDLNRSTRPGRDSTAQILLPLLREFDSRVRVSMFRSPNLRGTLAKVVPPRFNEGWGTWHAKIYGADDDVMISGANLNKSYFTDRQDRYLVFRGLPDVSGYCLDFMRTAKKFSYTLSLPSSRASQRTQYSITNDEYELHWPMPATHPHNFNSIAEAAFIDLQKTVRERLLNGAYSKRSRSSQDIMLVPLIQAGQFNIREEESLFQQLFLHLSRVDPTKRPLLDLTSGYFSLYKPYQDLLLSNHNVDCRIVASSPKANGFYGSRGISGRIPEGYTLFEQRFMTAVEKAGRRWHLAASETQGRGVLLNEWEKEGWTYHAKGIWLSPNTSTPPILTLFGSTNLNSRSSQIDTELSFLMIIPPEESCQNARVEPCLDAHSPIASLREDLAREVQHIRSNADRWKGETRPIRFTTKMIVSVLKGML